jgi:hypothetical protein
MAQVHRATSAATRKALAIELSHRRPELRSVLHAAGQLLATAGQQAIEENDRP